jgi:isopenicillin-N epimerase
VTAHAAPSTFPRARPRGSDLASRWALDPSIVYLNHGSFGACPVQVLDEQVRLRTQMEAEAVRFFIEQYTPLLDASRDELARFVGCSAEDLVFVPNATTGVATCLEHLAPALRPGDEILAGMHEYPACMNNLRRTAARTGARVVTATIPFPARSPEEIAEAIGSMATPRTRVALLSHITSPSALVLPLERIVPALESRGIAVIVDGAHAPGQVSTLNLGALGASFYTANCHKWVCSPKGSALLHVRRDRQEGFRPLVLSNSAERPRPGRKHLLTEFDYVGTTDVTAWMCVGAAVGTMGSMVPGGWPEVMRRNHSLALHGRELLCRALGVEAPAPAEMLASMATLFLPEHPPERLARLAQRPTRYHDALQDALVDRHGIQVPVWSAPGDPRRLIRISAQLYNSPAEYEYLSEALAEELARERAL